MLHPMTSILVVGACVAIVGCGVTTAAPIEELSIPVEEYQDRVYASWLGQIVGNIYGLPHENQHIDKPGVGRFPYGYQIENPVPGDFLHGYESTLPHVEEVGGAFSDDDTDIEYMYLLAMEKYGVEPKYAELAQSWTHHVRNRVWLANRAALGLMTFGYEPPATGMKAYNPHWFQIDPQLVNEIWAVTAPGMVNYAVDKSAWAARVTNDGWGIEPTMFYGAMFSAAFFESDVNALIARAIEAMPADSRFVGTVRDIQELHKQYPDDWQAARKEMAQEYYHNEPADTRTIWNANLNAAAGILALLYGDNDFQQTLDLACAMGFDADNQAATMAGLLGAALGIEGIPDALLYPVEGWSEPFNDVYVNETRADMADASIKDMARRMAALGEAIILHHGGRKSTVDGEEVYLIDTRARFTPPLELPGAPPPRMEVGQSVDYRIVVTGSESPSWTIEGPLPPGMQFDAGRLHGVPRRAGVYPVVISARRNGSVASRDYGLVVRGENMAPDAAAILANVRDTNIAARDSMWLTVGSSLYTGNVTVIRDGTTTGAGSTFYSIDGSHTRKQDHYGYEWEEPREIGLIGFHTGSMEENGGWFTSLRAEYRDENGQWQPVDHLEVVPELVAGEQPYTKPHFVEYLLAFEPVTTDAVRIIGYAGGTDHWYSAPAWFTSITELSVHGPLPGREQLATAPDTSSAADSPAPLRHLVPKDWWVHLPAIVRVELRKWNDNPVFSLDPDIANRQMDALKAKGFRIIEVFAPFEGGYSYHGLDAVNRYRLHPGTGTMDDFRRVVRLAHLKHMPVITFDNLGYSGVEAVDFLKAAEDVRAGRDSREASFYLWSDSRGAPPPGDTTNSYFLVRPTHLPGEEPGTLYDSEKWEFWEYNERADKYYWTKWDGYDEEGEGIRLPQYNWASDALQEEAERIVRFWMDTGIDGMIIDAVNWYINYTWDAGRKRITSVIHSYGNTFVQPEAAGGSHEDPVAWITEGGWNCVQDYGLGIWWEDGTNVIVNAIESGDPRPIEPALRGYHDRVVAAGGVNYFEPPHFDEPAKYHLSTATVAFLGDLIYMYHERALSADEEVQWILETKRLHPALHNLSTRRKIPTRADDRHYAFLQTAADEGEQVLVVTNFRTTAETVNVDLSGVDADALVDLRTGETHPRSVILPVELPPFGYRLFVVRDLESTTAGMSP